MKMTVNELMNMRDQLEEKLENMETYQDGYWETAGQINIISTTIHHRIKMIRGENNGSGKWNHQQV